MSPMKQYTSYYNDMEIVLFRFHHLSTLVNPSCSFVTYPKLEVHALPRRHITKKLIQFSFLIIHSFVTFLTSSGQKYQGPVSCELCVNVVITHCVLHFWVKNTTVLSMITFIDVKKNLMQLEACS